MHKCWLKEVYWTHIPVTQSGINPFFFYFNGYIDSFISTLSCLAPVGVQPPQVKYKPWAMVLMVHCSHHWLHDPFVHWFDPLNQFIGDSMVFVSLEILSKERDPNWRTRDPSLGWDDWLPGPKSRAEMQAG